MKVLSLFRHTALLCVFLSLLGASAAFAQDNGNWKLVSTTRYGTGGFWEDGQKVRIDCSYDGGKFTHVRKLSVGTSLYRFATYATFSGLKNEYAPGERIAINVRATTEGDQRARPREIYARVTVVNGNPGWTKSNWPSKKIPSASAAEGQLTNDKGHFRIWNGQTVFSGKVPSSGSRMAVIYSCNNMDVLFQYERAVPGAAASGVPASSPGASASTSASGSAVQSSEGRISATPSASELKDIAERNEAGPDVAQEEESSPAVNEIDTEEQSIYIDSGFPFKKLLIVGGIALLLIFLILFAFRKRPDKATPASRPVQEAEVSPTVNAPITAAAAPAAVPVPEPETVPEPKPVPEPETVVEPEPEPEPEPATATPRFCPNCGTRLDDDAMFCHECGTRIV